MTEKQILIIRNLQTSSFRKFGRQVLCCQKQVMSLLPLFFAAINREKGHIGIEAPLATGSGRDRDVSDKCEQPYFRL